MDVRAVLVDSVAPEVDDVAAREAPLVLVALAVAVPLLVSPTFASLVIIADAPSGSGTAGGGGGRCGDDDESALTFDLTRAAMRFAARLADEEGVVALVVPAGAPASEAPFSSAKVTLVVFSRGVRRGDALAARFHADVALVPAPSVGV